MSWSQLIEDGKKLIADGDRRYLDAEMYPDEMGVLLFTSGTTGIAKGVMLSQTNICCDLMSAPTLLDTNERDTFFSVLPLHHTYECTCGFLMPMYKGSCIGYCEGLKYIQKNLQEIKPTFFLGVPLIFEMLYKAIWKNIRKQGKEETVKKVLKLNKVTSKVGINLNKLLLKEYPQGVRRQHGYGSSPAARQSTRRFCSFSETLESWHFKATASRNVRRWRHSTKTLIRATTP